MLQGSGAMPTLVVEEGPSDYSSDPTDVEDSPSPAPTTLPRSRWSDRLLSLSDHPNLMPVPDEITGALTKFLEGAYQNLEPNSHAM